MHFDAFQMIQVQFQNVPFHIQIYRFTASRRYKTVYDFQLVWYHIVSMITVKFVFSL